MATVAIIGRPNVGKSTLFNRLVGRRLALVDDSPGVTRDRRLGEARLMDLDFEIMDTAGLEEASAGTLQSRMREQTEAALSGCDLVLFLIDARAGVMPQDAAFADIVRRAPAPVILLANKAEGRGADAALADAWSLGLGEPVAVSAEHGEGMGDLRDAMVEALGADAFESRDPAEEAEVEVAVSDEAGGEAALERATAPDRPLRVAIVGRPNAGKSTLVNRFLGEERLLTGPEAGITRDAISVEWLWRERRIKMFDTAGMRRKAKVHEKLEKLSVADGLRAVRFAEVVVVAIDATVPFERQDLAIADLVVREGRAPVVALMKWDLVEDRQRTLSELREMAERLLPQARGLRTVPVSGETGEGLEALMRAVAETHAVWNRRVPTAKLNQWLEKTVARHAPPAVAGRRVTLKYMTQIKSRPPTFLISTSRPEALGPSYLRFLVNGLREDFGLRAVPIRITLRKPENPYAGRSRKGP